MDMEKIFELHRRLYMVLCGVHPHRYFWHAQWLSVKDLYHDLRQILPTLTGRILDVGCRDKPYAIWLTHVKEHVGLDILSGPKVDHIIEDGCPWPVADASINAVICTQVVQHTQDVPHVIRQIDRVLADGGHVVLTAPFCYNDMSVNSGKIQIKDFWRYSVHGAAALFPSNYEIVALHKQGGAGSTLGVLLLNWIQEMFSTNLFARTLFVLATPIWILFTTGINIIGFAVDKIDRTGSFYHNVFVVARKQPISRGL